MTPEMITAIFAGIATLIFAWGRVQSEWLRGDLRTGLQRVVASNDQHNGDAKKRAKKNRKRIKRLEERYIIEAVKTRTSIDSLVEQLANGNGKYSPAAEESGKEKSKSREK